MNRNQKIMSVIFIVPAFTTLFLELYMPVHAQNTSIVTDSNRRDSVSGLNKSIDAIRNPDFVSINTTSGLPMYWSDSFGSCGSLFECVVNTTDGWFSNGSFQLSTRNNTNNTWSWISSQEIAVRPGEEYGIVAHMKLNEWARQSHILIEGLNDSTGEWYRIQQCPSGINGPIEWRLYDCNVTIPTNTSAIVLTLNAGWSSQVDKNALTSFDAIHAYKTIGELASD